MTFDLKKVARPTIIIAVIIAAFFITKQLFFNKQHSAFNPTITVKTVTPKLMTVTKRVKALGTIAAEQAITVSPEIPGQISSISFKEGTKVNKGTVLVTLDDRRLSAELKAAEASLALSKLTYERSKRLHSKGLQTQQQLDAASTDLQAKKAEVDVRQSLLGKTKLTASFDGYLGTKRISIGEYVTPGMPIVKLTNLDRLKVSYSLPEQYITLLKTGQSVQIESNLKPGTINADISYIAPDIDKASRTIEVEAKLPFNSGLMPGLFVKVSQAIAKRTKAIMLSEDAVLAGEEGFYVFVVENGHAVKRIVSLGALRKDNRVEILKGISSTDNIVSEGHHKLSDGTPVQYAK